ncbi:hypothetical protein NNO_1991 [Hydrogenimonas sp.]|nr:hypothetical protein NNO_1991 [Hydrogenimonas sp.]
MSGAVNVCIVAFVSLILNVRSSDCNTALTLFRCIVDLIVIHQLRITFCSENRSDRCSKCSFTVVNVTDSTDVNVRLGSFEFFLSHKCPP